MAKAQPYPRLSESQQELFWSKIKIGPEEVCWPWQRALKGRGYGALRVNKQSLSAHRVAYILTFGPAPEDLFVFQTCGRNECCNPAHLTTGTMGDAAKIEKKPYIDPKDQQMPSVEERFWSRVDKKSRDGCWEWTAGKDDHGYGKLSNGKGRHVKTHRYSWALHNGPIKKGLCILHKCDNPPCVNPEHLFAGTQLANIADMVKKKRHRIGAENPNAVLNEAKVKEIKKLLKEGVPNKDIAVRMGVSRPLISLIKHDRRWGANRVVITGKGVGEKNPNAVLDKAKVRKIKRLLAEKVKNKEIAARMGVTRSLISLIKNGKRWGHVL